MQHAWANQEIYTKFWLENLRRRDHSKGLGIDKRIILKEFIGKQK
jgi:hypothetical protein